MRTNSHGNDSGASAPRLLRPSSAPQLHGAFGSHSSRRAFHLCSRASGSLHGLARVPETRPVWRNPGGISRQLDDNVDCRIFSFDEEIGSEDMQESACPSLSELFYVDS
uniref:Uncharacterized protein n=1 Tax=Noctiluca scintillans TaxID=2966 RepID=A0A7S1B157_NOCSC|mmetsp:Transcript_886/g.2510  ORF Transcript_886/g.2510 Transcript_886/m.2510 type:complete len:109 (+) Transcript_886:75-401(+)